MQHDIQPTQASENAFDLKLGMGSKNVPFTTKATSDEKFLACQASFRFYYSVILLFSYRIYRAL